MNKEREREREAGKKKKRKKEKVSDYKAPFKRIKMFTKENNL